MDVYDEPTRVKAPENLGEVIAEMVFSQEEREGYSKIIKDFSQLYYNMSKQTWGNTKWRGVPILKAPTDLWIYQELIEKIQPDLIIETGTCFGGSALYLRDICHIMNLYNHIISIDISHENLSEKARSVSGIQWWEGSSVSDEILVELKAHIAAYESKRVMVILDSDHSKEHVIKELELYSPLVTKGSIIIVEDTNTDGPYQAIKEWLPNNKEFEPNYMCEKFMLTFNREGYLERV